MMIHQPVKNCNKKESRRHFLILNGQTGSPNNRRHMRFGHAACVGRAAPYQNSSSHGRDGVPSLSPVHIAVAVPAPDPVQETWHDSAEKVQTATQLVADGTDSPTVRRWHEKMLLSNDEQTNRRHDDNNNNNNNHTAFFSGDFYSTRAFIFAFMCRPILLFVGTSKHFLEGLQLLLNGWEAKLERQGREPNAVSLCGGFRSALVSLATTFLPLVWFSVFCFCRLK